MRTIFLSLFLACTLFAESKPPAESDEFKKIKFSIWRVVEQMRAIENLGGRDKFPADMTDSLFSSIADLLQVYEFHTESVRAATAKGDRVDKVVEPLEKASVQIAHRAKMGAQRCLIWQKHVQNKELATAIEDGGKLLAQAAMALGVYVHGKDYKVYDDKDGENQGDDEKSSED